MEVPLSSVFAGNALVMLSHWLLCSLVVYTHVNTHTHTLSLSLSLSFSIKPNRISFILIVINTLCHVLKHDSNEKRHHEKFRHNQKHHEEQYHHRLIIEARLQHQRYNQVKKMVMMPMLTKNYNGNPEKE
jgi:hypothetical protein